MPVFLEPGGLGVWGALLLCLDTQRAGERGAGTQTAVPRDSEGECPAPPRKARFQPQTAARPAPLGTGSGELTPPLVPRPLPRGSCSLGFHALSLLRASLGILTVDEVTSL